MNKIWETDEALTMLEQPGLPYPGDEAIAERFRAKRRIRRRLSLRAAVAAAVIVVLSCATVLAAALLPVQEARNDMGIHIDNPVEGWMEFDAASLPPAQDENGTVELVASIRSEDQAVAYFVIQPMSREVAEGDPKATDCFLLNAWGEYTPGNPQTEIEVVSYDEEAQTALVRSRLLPQRGYAFPDRLIFTWQACRINPSTGMVEIETAYPAIEVPLTDGGCLTAQVPGTVMLGELEGRSLRAEVSPLQIRLITKLPLPEGTEAGADITVYLCSWNDTLKARAETMELELTDSSRIPVRDLPSWANLGWHGVEFTNEISYAAGDSVEVSSLLILDQALDIREISAVIVDGTAYPLS